MEGFSSDIPNRCSISYQPSDYMEKLCDIQTNSVYSMLVLKKQEYQMPLEAMYGIEFISDKNRGGYGVVILDTGRFLGGDSSFVYAGSYEVKNGDLHIDVNCKNYRKTLESVFKGKDEFNLHLQGKPEYNEFTLKGDMVEDPEEKIIVKLTRVGELPSYRPPKLHPKRPLPRYIDFPMFA